MIQIVYARSEPYLTCDGMCWQLAWLSELADIGGATTRASGGALVCSIGSVALAAAVFTLDLQARNVNPAIPSRVCWRW